MQQRTKCPMKILLYLLIALLSELLASVTANFGEIFRVENVTFFPATLSKIKEGTAEQISFFMSLDHHSLPAKSTGIIPKDFNLPRNLSICYHVEDPAVAWTSAAGVKSGPCTQFPIENYFLSEISDQKSSGQKIVHLVDTNFTVGGLFLGKTNVIVEIYADQGKSEKNAQKSTAIYSQKYPVTVVRKNHKMQHIFVGTLSILLIVANILMGAQLNLSVVWEVIQKPIAPCIGFVCQCLFMPLISYTIAQLIFVPYGLHTLGLGLFTTGCSPGGGASNGYTFLMEGNVDLSITMTFISTVTALVIMPFWMFSLGHNFLVSSPGALRINVPYSNICFSLVALVVPLILGAVIRHFRKNFAEKANKILRPFLLLIIAFICTFGVYANFYMFRLMSWRVLAAGMCLPTLGFLFGATISTILKQPLGNIKAIAIETGIQNTGIGIVLLQLSFGQPDADLAAVVPVVVAMFTPPPLLAALAVHYALKWHRTAADRLKEHQRQSQRRTALDDAINENSTDGSNKKSLILEL